MQYFHDIDPSKFAEILTGQYIASESGSEPVIISAGQAYQIAQTMTERALPNDIVYFTNQGQRWVESSLPQIHGVKERKRHLVPAVLMLSDTRIIGLNKKGIPIYKAVPVDSRYPIFYVASNAKKKSITKDCYILLEFHQWLTTQKFPHGKQVSIIGPVGDPLAEQTVLLYKHGIYSKDYRALTQTQTQTQCVHRRQTFSAPDYQIIAIDPKGSKDYDDAFHFKLDTDSGEISEIGIHIADVSSYFKESNIQFETEIKKHLCTIYLPDRKINMIPESYADNLCSLISGQPRNSVTVIFKPESGQSEIILSQITVSKNLTYEEADSRFSSDLDPLRKYFRVSDSHQIVEKLMVLANSIVGQKISDAGWGLIRTHTCTPRTPRTPLDLGTKLSQVLQFYHESAAKYEFNPENKMHDILGISCYTHFTSPIRRYPDLLVHRIIKTHLLKTEPDAITLTKQELSETCQEINTYYRQVKKFYRDLAVLEIFNQINTKYHGIHLTDGYPIDFIRGKIYVYLPEFDLVYKYRVFSSKLEEIIGLEHCSDETLKFTVDKETFEIKLYKLYKIQLTTDTVTARLNNKIKMQIL